MYMIASKPAPRLADESKWSREMVDFLDKCLQKDPYVRATSADLAIHPWIQGELKEIRRAEQNGQGSSLAVLRTLAKNSQAALEDMRRCRQESSDTSTFQTFTAKIDDINTMETEAAKGGVGTWRTNTMETEAVHGTVGTWRTAAFNTFVRTDPDADSPTENDKTPRLSNAATWNAANFNNAEVADRGLLSEVSTPENTIRPSFMGGSVISGAGGNPGRAKSGTIDTLRNQLGTLRLNQSSFPYTAGGTMRTALDGESRNTLRKQLSQHEQGTLRQGLDPRSRATLQSQLRSEPQTAGPETRSRGGSVPSRPTPHSPDLISQHSVDSAASTQCNDRGSFSSTKPGPAKDVLRIQGDSAALGTLKRNFQWDLGGQPEVIGAGDVRLNEFATVSVASPNSRSLAGEVALADRPLEPFLAFKKFDSNGDLDPAGLMPLAPHFSVLTSQEGSLKFDNHEIQFKMAIYGAGGRSAGCRMEVRFGNVGEIS
jgi:serine/threonine protein kinase